MKKLRIGQFGVRHDHAFGKMECVRARLPDTYEIVGVAETHEENLEYLKHPAYDGVPVMSQDELLRAGLDCAMVETNEYELIPTAQLCVERGIPVHVDKPAGDNIESFKKLLKTARKAGDIPVQLAYMYRYNEAVMDCKSRIARGELGEIFQIDAIMNIDHPVYLRKWLECFDAGIMFYLGCHMVDLVFSIMGAPEKLTTFLKRTGFDGLSCVDNSYAALEYPKGISTVRSTSNEIEGFQRRQLVVCGEKGTYEIRPLEGRRRAFLSTRDDADAAKKSRREIELPTYHGEDRYTGLMREFARFVRGEIENPYTYEYELQLQKLVLACCGQNIDYKEVTKL